MLARGLTRLENADEARVLVLFFFPPSERRAPLEEAEMVEKELPVQVINLVLDRLRQQLAGTDEKLRSALWSADELSAEELAALMNQGGS